MEIHNNSLKNLIEIVDLTEVLEKEKIEKEVEKSRMRLDSGRKSKETLRREIGIETWEKSQVSFIRVILVDFDIFRVHQLIHFHFPVSFLATETLRNDSLSCLCD